MLHERDILLNFRDFLELNLPRISKYLGDELAQDWVQANWELIVESKLCKSGSEFLEVYGEGADCNGDSSRVWMPNATATHRVNIALCESTVDEFTGMDSSGMLGVERNLVFDRFVSWDGKVYAEAPPLDFLIASSSDKDYLLRADQIDFEVSAISPS